MCILHPDGCPLQPTSNISGPPAVSLQRRTHWYTVSQSALRSCFHASCTISSVNVLCRPILHFIAAVGTFYIPTKTLWNIRVQPEASNRVIDLRAFGHGKTNITQYQHNRVLSQWHVINRVSSPFSRAAALPYAAVQQTPPTNAFQDIISTDGFALQSLLIQGDRFYRINRLGMCICSLLKFCHSTRYLSS